MVYNMVRTYPPPKGLGGGCGRSIHKGGKNAISYSGDDRGGVLIMVEKAINCNGDERGASIDKGGKKPLASVEIEEAREVVRIYEA